MRILSIIGNRFFRLMMLLLSVVICCQFDHQLHAQGSTFPVTVIDRTPTAPLVNPTTSGSSGYRYVSGFGLDDSFTVFFEDRDNGQEIKWVTTTTGPTGFPAVPTATFLLPGGAALTDTHFVIKDWPVTIGGTTYVYRAWASDGNNSNHHFYVSNDLVNWEEPFATFTVANDPTFAPPDRRGDVYYGFHDVIRLNGTYYAWAETNQSQTVIVRSPTGQDDWEAFASMGGQYAAGGAPLNMPGPLQMSGNTGPTPTGSFFDLGGNRGYGKLHIGGSDEALYLAINTAARANLPPAQLEAAFIDPTNWMWNDGSTGVPDPSIALLSNTSSSGGHDVREAWFVSQSNPADPWTIIYTADYPGVPGGPRALGWIGVTPPPLPAPPTARSHTEKKKSKSPAIELSDPFITKIADPPFAIAGEEVTFTFTITNPNNVTIHNVQATDKLPDAVEILSTTATTGTVVVSGQEVDFEQATLGPRQTITVTIQTRVRDNISETLIINIACLTSPANSCAEATVIIAAQLPTTGTSPWSHWRLPGLVGLLLLGLLIEETLRRR